MAAEQEEFQPGAILHEVIVGCLRASGTNFDAWCRENNVNPTTAKQATFGQSGGDKGKALLFKLIEAAGRDHVELSYRSRIARHASGLVGEAAA